MNFLHLFPEFKMCMICHKPCFISEYYLLHAYNYEHYNIFYDLNFYRNKFCILCEKVVWKII